VDHSRDVKDCGGTQQRKFTLKPAKIPYTTMWQHWLGNTKPKKAYRLILNTVKSCYKIKKKSLNGIFYWLSNCLPAWYLQTCITQQLLRGLIFSLFDIASARAMPFAILLYIQCILHGLTTVLLCVPFIFVHHEKWWFCGRHVMASICYRNHP